jgi:hypothetical protein
MPSHLERAAHAKPKTHEVDTYTEVARGFVITHPFTGSPLRRLVCHQKNRAEPSSLGFQTAIKDPLAA